MRRVTSILPGSKRRWLWLWLQDRRRDRGGDDEGPSLMNGLVQFYKPQAGATFLKSMGEGEALPNNPFQGIVHPQPRAAAGGYEEGVGIRYDVFPYREIGERVYSGTAMIYNVTPAAGQSSVQWAAWTATPPWVSGYMILRYIGGAYAGFRDVATWLMQAGWYDLGSGWSAAEILPHNYNNPPRTAKAMWCFQDWAMSPPVMDTVMSPFGGVAFSSLYGDRLFRALSDDLRRSLDGTFAFWFCPTAETSGALGALRGVFSGSYFGDYNCYSSELYLGPNSEVGVVDHQDGDWYLAVFRHDTLTANHTISLMRQRDGATFTSDVMDLSYTAALDAQSDYLVEGLWAIVAVGDSGHWGVQSSALFDLIGLWNRPLSNHEVLELFNNGLGWQPS